MAVENNLQRIQNTKPYMLSPLGWLYLARYAAQKICEGQPYVVDMWEELDATNSGEQSYARNIIGWMYYYWSNGKQCSKEKGFISKRMGLTVDFRRFRASAEWMIDVPDKNGELMLGQMIGLTRMIDLTEIERIMFSLDAEVRDAEHFRSKDEFAASRKLGAISKIGEGLNTGQIQTLGKMMEKYTAK